MLRQRVRRGVYRAGIDILRAVEKGPRMKKNGVWRGGRSGQSNARDHLLLVH